MEAAGKDIFRDSVQGNCHFGERGQKAKVFVGVGLGILSESSDSWVLEGKRVKS